MVELTVHLQWSLNHLLEKLGQILKNVVAANWQKEIDVLQQELDRMYKDYEAEQVMLSEELRKKREDQLFVKEKELRDLQRKRFGFEGDLFKKKAGTDQADPG